MITSFRHKALRRYFEDDDGAGIDGNQRRRLRILLYALHTAHVIGDMRRPGFNLHALTGDRAGFWAVKVDGNYWLIFRFEDGNAIDVDLVDYH